MMQQNVLNFDEKELDKHIYRIMDEQHVLSIFKDRKNVLTQGQKWKDNFEKFQLRLGGIYDNQCFEYSFINDFVCQCWTRDGRSEAMWGIYANDPKKRYLRIRSTPRKLLSELKGAHQKGSQDTCFVGKVEYKPESEIKREFENSSPKFSSISAARTLLLKRKAFKHEREVRLIYIGNKDDCDQKGLYQYTIDPCEMITQIMADPNRDRECWAKQEREIRKKTGFEGEIKRSKAYDKPEWNLPNSKS